MDRLTLDLIQQIDRLWEEVYPYLAAHIYEVYGRSTGTVVEIGPFCGVIFELLKKRSGSSFLIGTFPPGMGRFFAGQAERQGLTGDVGIAETDPSLSALTNGSIDLAIFRGALFFPSLFRTDFRAIDRILRPAGMAFVGGGFGKYTPPSVINAIATRSRELNLMIGKTEVTEEAVTHDLASSRIDAHAEIVSEGGLWVIMKKG